MELIGDRFDQLERALLAAYPDEVPLKRMVRSVLGERLQAIAGGNNQTELIFSLLEWAESENKVGELLRGAHRHNPRNKEVRSFLLAHSQPFLATAVDENNSGLKSETVRSLIALLTTALPFEQTIAAGRFVLPGGASENPSDMDFIDFDDAGLSNSVRLFGLLKLLLTKFAQVKQQPTVLLYARELRAAVASEPTRSKLSRWIAQAAAERGLSLPPAAAQPALRKGTLEVALMITVRQHSKRSKPAQSQGKYQTQYQVNGYLYFDRIAGRTQSGSPHPLMELAFPSAQDQLGIVCTWAQLPVYVDQLLGAAHTELTHTLRQTLGYRNYRLSIETFLPTAFMDKDVDQWLRLSGEESLGYNHGVITRFCERIDDPERYNAISLEWERLEPFLQAPEGSELPAEQVACLECLNEPVSWPQMRVQFQTKLGLMLSCGLPEQPKDRVRLFETMLLGDVPIAVWTRSVDIVESCDLASALSSFLVVECCRYPVALSKKLTRVRQRAWAESSAQAKGRQLGDHLAILLDNPERLPLPPLFASL